MNLKRNIMAGAALIAVSMSNVIAMNMDAPNNAQDPSVVAAPALLPEHPLDFLDQDEKTLLMRTIEKGRFELAAFLIDNCVDINVKDKFGTTALMYAAEFDRTAILNLILNSEQFRAMNQEKRLETINATDSFPTTALMRAVNNRHTGSANILIKAGASTDVKDRLGHTISEIADSMGVVLGGENQVNDERVVAKEAIMALLPESYSQRDARDQDGKTSIIRSIEQGNNRILKFLIAIGSNMNIADNNGMTPLMHAIRKGKHQVVMFFISIGVNINAIDKSGRTVLMWAAACCNIEVIEYLAEMWVSMWNTRDNYGTTPVMYAIQGGHPEIATFLINRGVDIF